MAKVVTIEMSLKNEDVVKRYLPAKTGWGLTTGAEIKVDVEGMKTSLFIATFEVSGESHTGIFSWESGALISAKTYQTKDEQAEDIDSIINNAVVKLLTLTNFDFEVMEQDEKLNLQRVERMIGKKPGTSEYEVAEGLH